MRFRSFMPAAAMIVRMESAMCPWRPIRRTEIKKRNRVGVAAEIEIYQVLREDQNTGFKAQIRAIKRQKQS
jgi:hypothetical protein